MDTPQPGIYLMIDFAWPEHIDKELAGKAYALHSVVQDKDWIKEVVAASGGLGAGPSSVWVFWLENYAALEKLLRAPDDPVGQAYLAFFKEMPVVNEKLREEVVFM